MHLLKVLLINFEQKKQAAVKFYSSLFDIMIILKIKNALSKLVKENSNFLQ